MKFFNAILIKLLLVVGLGGGLFGDIKYPLIPSKSNFPYLIGEGNGKVRVHNPDSNFPYTLMLHRHNSEIDYDNYNISDALDDYQINYNGIMYTWGRSRLSDILLGQQSDPLLNFAREDSLSDGIYTIYLTYGAYISDTLKSLMISNNIQELKNMTVNDIGTLGLIGAYGKSICSTNNYTLQDCLELMSAMAFEHHVFYLAAANLDPTIGGVSALSEVASGIDEVEFGNNAIESFYNSVTTTSYNALNSTEKLMQNIYPSYNRETFKILDYVLPVNFEMYMYFGSLVATTWYDTAETIIKKFTHSNLFGGDSHGIKPIHFAILNGIPVSVQEYKNNQKNENKEPLVNIDVVKYPQVEVPLGEYIKIEIEATNFGGNSEEGYISVGIPSFNSSNDTILTTEDSYKKGDQIWSQNSHQFSAEYALVDFVDHDWKANKTNKLIIELKPKQTGKFEFYVRSAAKLHNGTYQNWTEEYDTIDQQGFQVKKYSFNVVSPPIEEDGDIILPGNGNSPEAYRIEPSSPTIYPNVGDSVKFKISALDEDSDLDYVKWIVDSSIADGDDYDPFGDDENIAGSEHLYTTFKNNNNGQVVYLHADVYDKEGNKDRVTWNVYPIQTYAPVVTPENMTDNPLKLPLGEHDFIAKIYDQDDNGETLEWYLDDVLVETDSTNNANPATTEKVTLTFTERGAHTLKAVAIDEDGNKGEYIWTFEVGAISDGYVKSNIEFFDFTDINAGNTNNILYPKPSVIRQNKLYHIRCNASNLDPQIMKMEMFINNELISSHSNSSPDTDESRHEYISFDQVGEQSITCKVTDSTAEVIEKTIHFNVLAKNTTSGTPPQIYNFYPTSNTIYSEGDYIEVAFNIKDVELDAQKLNIYINNQLVDVKDINLRSQFDNNIDGFSNGTNTLKIVPVDSNGNEGNSITKTVIANSSNNATPKVYASFPNHTTINVLKHTLVEPIVVLAEDANGDLDDVEWDFTNVRPVNSSLVHKSSYNIDTSNVSDYYDTTSETFRPSQSGTIYARAVDDNGVKSTPISFYINVIENESDIPSNSPEIINSNYEFDKTYHYLGNDDIGFEFDFYDKDGDLKDWKLEIKKSDESSWTTLYSGNSTESSNYFHKNSLLSDIDIMTQDGNNIVSSAERGTIFNIRVSASDFDANIITKEFNILRGGINEFNSSPNVLTSYVLDINQRETKIFTIENVFDEEGDVLIPTIESMSNGGEVKYIGNNSFKYIPEESYSGIETFRIKWDDQYGGIAQTDVTVNITRIIENPKIIQNTISIVEPYTKVIDIYELLKPYTIVDIYSFNNLTFNIQTNSNIEILSPSTIKLISGNTLGEIVGYFEDPDNRQSNIVQININASNIDDDDMIDDVDPDDDNDGMSDEYENTNGLKPYDLTDANLDPDEDGKTNLEEYQDGTNPQEKTSKMFTLNLKQGWNLVSLELNSTVDLNTIDNTNIEVVRSLKNDQWSTWTKENLNNPDQYFNILEDGYGYWVKATQDTSIEIKGEGESDTVTITPNQWNMIGSIKYEDINQFFIDNPNVKMIWKYKGGQYHVISNDINIDSDLTPLESNGDVIELQSIENNEGVFVK